ncbi:collagen, type I, alpha 1a-like [Cavia porcellus]|uniref:collagen, type I, alpha 1a-like n=1 Tax=Cavia porcellus TaxID=10141 RepID=UPI002FE2E11F
MSVGGRGGVGARAGDHARLPELARRRRTSEAAATASSAAAAAELRQPRNGRLKGERDEERASERARRAAGRKRRGEGGDVKGREGAVAGAGGGRGRRELLSARRSPRPQSGGAPQRPGRPPREPAAAGARIQTRRLGPARCAGGLCGPRAAAAAGPVVRRGLAGGAARARPASPAPARLLPLAVGASAAAGRSKRTGARAEPSPSCATAPGLLQRAPPGRGAGGPEPRGQARGAPGAGAEDRTLRREGPVFLKFQVLVLTFPSKQNKYVVSIRIGFVMLKQQISTSFWWPATAKLFSWSCNESTAYQQVLKMGILKP